MSSLNTGSVGQLHDDYCSKAIPNRRAMKDTICLVTGASSGIGRATVFALARMQARVILAVRDKDRGMEVMKELQDHTGNRRVELIVADLSCLQSVHQLVTQFQAVHDRLHLLVNCAGAAYVKRKLSVDGIEMTFAGNHLGPFALTTSLLSTLKNSSPARIINVASEAHRPNKIDFDDLEWKRRKYIGYAGDLFRPTAYGQSKLANVLFTYELARRLSGTGVVSNSLHPGFVATNFCKNNRDPLNLLFALLAPLRISPARSAQAVIHLATSAEMMNVTGKYFNQKRMVQSSPASYDRETGERLWRVSEQMIAQQS